MRILSAVMKCLSLLSVQAGGLSVGDKSNVSISYQGSVSCWTAAQLQLDAEAAFLQFYFISWFADIITDSQDDDFNLGLFLDQSDRGP